MTTPTREQIIDMIDRKTFGYRETGNLDAGSVEAAADAILALFAEQTARVAEKKYYIVWNEVKSEGFVTNDFGDAIQCQNGEFNHVHSAMAYEFHNCYEDDELILEKVMLP